MAIQKTKVLANGVSGNFWVVRGVYMSADYSGVRAFADLYVSAGDSVSGVPIYKEDIILDGIDNPIHLNNLVGLVEQKLISMPGDFVSGIVI
jgi:hypothetical protein